MVPCNQGCAEIGPDTKKISPAWVDWPPEKEYYELRNKNLVCLVKMPVRGDEVLVPRDSFFTVSGPESFMEVGPAFGLHHFTEGKKDSETKTPGAATVYLTDYTPFRRVISIRP